MRIKKPKLWKYKSGKKKGKLRTKAKKYLSYKLKLFWKIKKRKERIRIIKVRIPKPRIRRQVCYNCIYSISLRAITVNTEITEQELRNALDQFIEYDTYLGNIPFGTVGFEEEKISPDEDKSLKEDLIYIELNVRGNTTLVTV